MLIDEWAKVWGIPKEALHDLKVRIGIATQHVANGEERTGSEARQQQLVRLEAAQLGIWLTRNNVGALKDERGIPVRYGLANESKEQNKVIKSGDLIGIRPVVITFEMVGRTIGQFVSREIKHEGWKWKGDKHEVAQLQWATFVNAKGGDAAFATGPGSFTY